MLSRRFALLTRRQTARRMRKQDEAAPATPADKRDRAVVAPGTPFNGQSLLAGRRAMRRHLFQARHSLFGLRGPREGDQAGSRRLRAFTKEADEASKTATVFFTAAERFLIADRKLARDEAVLTYDPLATQNGDRLKTVEAALQAAKPCAELYKICRGAFPQVCNDSAALTN